MRKLKEKQCNNCGKTYLPTGSCSKYCVECKPEMRRQLANKGCLAYRTRQGKQVGVGSGGTTGRGKDNHMYKHGHGIFRNQRTQVKAEQRYCNHCDKDLIEATHYQWVIHHKDHNRYNNPEDGSNWVLLCKKCHQVEHKCWLALEGATTRLIRLPDGRYARDDRRVEDDSKRRAT